MDGSILTTLALANPLLSPLLFSLPPPLNPPPLTPPTGKRVCDPSSTAYATCKYQCGYDCRASRASPCDQQCQLVYGRKLAACYSCCDNGPDCTMCFQCR